MPEGSCPSGVLEEMTIEDVRSLNPEVVVVPIGSTEPHGPHLPYGTDNYETEGICRSAVQTANAAGGRVLLYPMLPIGNNVNFKAFPFACRISVRTLMQVVADIVQALEEDGIRKVVLVNGHGGNPEALQAAVREHVGNRPPGEGAFLCIANFWGFIPREVWAQIEHPSDHAGESETSLMLHLRPDLVRSDKLAAFPTRKPVLEQLGGGRVYFVRPWHAFMPEIAGGETRASTAEKGKLMAEAAATGLAGFLTDLSNSPMHSQFPYPDPHL